MTTKTQRRPATATRKSGSSSKSTRPIVEVEGTGPTAAQVLLGAVAILSLLGLTMVYSASSVEMVRRGQPSWTMLARQLVWMLGGFGLAAVAMRIPISTWRDRLTVPLLVIAITLQGFLALDIVLQKIGLGGLPMAITVNGATRWVGYGQLRAQPSDFVKLSLILWLARLLDMRHRQIGTTDLLRPVLVVTGALGALVLMGDDLGTTILLGVIMLVMLLAAGTPFRHLASITAVGGALAVIVIFLFEGFRLKRISAFLNPSGHMSTEGYQLLQSQIGFASGGFWGSGPGNSRAKWGYLPEAHTDFILSVIGEELGLVGTLIVLGAFVVLMGAGLRIAISSRTRFGNLAAIGITTWIGVQALINIGVSIGMLPTKGITLPFVSYGGSSLLMCLVAVGVLLSVARDPA